MKLICNDVCIGTNLYSIVGCSHKGQSKMENQDSFGWRCQDDRIILVVCDGLGSAKKSAEGSKTSVEVALDVLSEPIDENTPSRILKEWKRRIPGDPREYDTTCKFIAICNESTYYGGVGDGWIALNTDDGVVQLSTASEFTNQTDSLLCFDIKHDFTIKKIETESIRSILIATDGFSEDLDKQSAKELLYESYENMGECRTEFLFDLYKTVKNWPVPTNQDDKTVLFIRRANNE